MPLDLSHIMLSAGNDLYCTRCGYNLRGLDGDPRRCPECGHQNPLAELLLPAERISAQLRRLESAPTMCFGACLLVGLGLLFVVSFSQPPTGSTEIAMQSVGAGLLLCGIVTWFVSCRSFAQSCLRRPGWIPALARFHAYAVAIFALGFAAIIGTGYCMMVIVMSAFGGAARWLSPLLLAAACWIAAVILIRWLYRRLKRGLVPLQREVAVQMYIEEHS